MSEEGAIEGSKNPGKGAPAEKGPRLSEAGQAAKAAREARLAAALRANLRKRKAQSRARGAGGGGA